MDKVRKNSLEHVLAKNTWERFSFHMEKLTHMKKAQDKSWWMGVLTHDALPTALSSVEDAHPDIIRAMNKYRASAADSSTLIKSVRDFGDLVPVFDTSEFQPPDFVKEFIPEYVSAARAYTCLAPTLSASMDFIAHPNIQTYNRLRKQKVDSRHIVDFLMIPNVQLEGTLNGFMSIVLLNILKNAQRHVIDNSIQLKADEQTGCIQVSNLSIDDLPEGVFELGVRGKNGNSGIGLFVSRMYAELLGLTLTARSENKGDGKYEVSFTVSPQSADPQGNT